MKVDRPKRWSIRMKSPTASELKSLEAMIHTVAPKASNVARVAALKELRTGIRNFRQYYPYVWKGKKVRGSITQKRASLAKLVASMRDAQKDLKKLSLDAKLSFGHKIKTPIGKVVGLLQNWEVAARDSYIEAMKVGDRRIDDAPSFLACDVARTLSHTLKVRVALTGDQYVSGQPRGGAAYSRLLRATIEAAGGTAPNDLRPIMKVGKSLFDESSENDE